MSQDVISKKELYIEIGERIAEYRHRKSLTQENLAYDIDVSVQYISNLERGVVGASIETIIKICRVLEAPSDYILLGENPIIEADFANPAKSAHIDLNQLSKRQLDNVSNALNTILSSGTK